MSYALDAPQFDDVGIIQKLYGHEMVNIGSRTILKGVKRLLPGELIQIEIKQKLKISKFYDNTLGSINDKFNCSEESVTAYWKKYKQEIDILLNEEKNCFIATSGGMDSRILLGAISEDVNLTCLTYGHSDDYETKIAKRLAKKKNANFKNFVDYSLFFPSLEILNKYVKDSELLNISAWLQILENVEQKKNSMMLLGDMCEVLPARNIKAFSSRKSRIQNFLNI